MLIRAEGVSTYFSINPWRGQDENGRNKVEGKGFRIEEYLWVIKGRIDSENSKS
jgi:hypothetical protein